MNPDPAAHRRYRGIVGSLGYLVNMTRPDLAWAYSELSKYVQFPGKPHMLAAEHVLRYLRGTYNKYILYSRDVPRTLRNVLWTRGRLIPIGPVTLTRADRTLDTSSC